MRILVTNDDGIYADGLWVLVEALAQQGEVVVVAPDREQSGVGASTSLHQPLRVNKFNSPLPGIESYTVEGTPADAVILGLSVIEKDKVDIVFAGINHGANLSNDVFISGTVGAAFQAHFLGLPAIAISVVIGKGVPHLDNAASLAVLLAQRFASGSLPVQSFLNINLPDLPLRQITGIESVRLGRKSYINIIKEGHDLRKKYYWIERGKPDWDTEAGTDTGAVSRGKISVVSLNSDLTCSPSQLDLTEVCDSLFEELRSAAAVDAP